MKRRKKLFPISKGKFARVVFYDGIKEWWSEEKITATIFLHHLNKIKWKIRAFKTKQK